MIVHNHYINMIGYNHIMFVNVHKHFTKIAVYNHLMFVRKKYIKLKKFKWYAYVWFQSKNLECLNIFHFHYF